MENTLNDGIDSKMRQPIGKTHPLVIAAAGAVLVFSLLGIAAMTGVLPNALSQKPSEPAASATTPTAPAAPTALAAAKWHETRPTARPAHAHAPAPAPAPVHAAACANCGTIESVRAIETKGSGSGLGTVAGGLTGAVVGSQIGRGNGNTAMTILGAAGGALAGNEIEKNLKKQVSYRVTIRMDDGSYRTVSQSGPAAIGEKVRIVDGSIVARS